MPPWATTGLSTDVGWSPGDHYDYRPLTTAAQVRTHALTSTGAGRLTVTAPSGR